MKNSEKIVHPDPFCYGCGEKNSCGLQVEAKVEGDKVIGILTIKEFFQGFKKLSHGGPLMAALDEVMSYVPFIKGDGVYLTREIAFRFIRGVFLGSRVIIEAKEKKSDEKICVVEGIMKDEEGKIYIEAEAAFIKIDDKKVKEYS